MRIISNLFAKIIRSHRPNSSAGLGHIIYKIVDFSEKKQEYSIQCISTKAIFKQRINDIVFDPDILHGLHPMQSCYIGLMSGQKIEQIWQKSIKSRISQMNFLISRYGRHEIRGQLRNGDVCFFDNISSVDHIMHPRDICLSTSILSEFDASHAYYIGMYAAMKSEVSERTSTIIPVRKKPNLTLIKRE